jgi:hypothetical protein
LYANIDKISRNLVGVKKKKRTKQKKKKERGGEIRTHLNPKKQK